MEKATFHAKLIAYEEDSENYITYVFKLLDQSDIDLLKQNYLMCVRYPNWEHSNLKLFISGYVNILEVIGGVDKYYDGEQLICYKYSNTQFIKFVEEPNENLLDKKIILD